MDLAILRKLILSLLTFINELDLKIFGVVSKLPDLFSPF